MAALEHERGGRHAVALTACVSSPVAARAAVADTLETDNPPECIATAAAARTVFAALGAVAADSTRQ